MAFCVLCASLVVLGLLSRLLTKLSINVILLWLVGVARADHLTLIIKLIVNY